jgi:hypothetical protein
LEHFCCYFFEKELYMSKGILPTRPAVYHVFWGALFAALLGIEFVVALKLEVTTTIIHFAIQAQAVFACGFVAVFDRSREKSYCFMAMVIAFNILMDWQLEQASPGTMYRSLGILIATYVAHEIRDGQWERWTLRNFKKNI